MVAPGNARVRRFESRLAGLILNTVSGDALRKVNAAMVRYLEKNKELLEKNKGLVFKEDRDELGNLENLLAIWNFYPPPGKGIDFLLDKLKEEPPNPLVLYDVHKVCFERLFDPMLTHMNEQRESLLSLSTLAQIAMLNAEDKQKYKDLNTLWDHYLRIDKLFSDENRGRISLKETEHDQGLNEMFGIAGYDSEEWAMQFRWEQFGGRRVIPGGSTVTADPNSPVVQYCIKHNIPFVTGPSGSLTYILKYLPYLSADLSSTEIKEYVEIIGAVMIAYGHHSIFEIMAVAAQFNLYTEIDDEGNRRPMRYPFANSDLAHMYNEFLTGESKSIEAYDLLVKKFPDFLSKEVSPQLSGHRDTLFHTRNETPSASEPKQPGDNAVEDTEPGGKEPPKP